MSGCVCVRACVCVRVRVCVFVCVCRVCKYVRFLIHIRKCMKDVQGGQHP